MFARRQIVLGGLLTITGGMFGCGCAQAARQDHVAHSGHPGCVLAEDRAARFLARDLPGHADRDDPIIARSDDRDFDYALAQTLSDLTDTFGVLPGFAYYDDHTAENAYATSARRLGKPDGTVLFGRRFLQSLLAKGSNSEVAVAAICAHEFGHIAQFKSGMVDRLLEGQRTVKRAELHADFLAGYYAGMRKLRRPDYPAAVFAAGLYGLQSSPAAAQAHGSNKERAEAITRGFETAHRDRRSFSEAMTIGFDYVHRKHG